MTAPPSPYHKVKVEQVVDTHGFQRQRRGAEVGALNLGHRRGEHLVLIGALGVQAETLPGTRATGAAGALPRARPREESWSIHFITYEIESINRLFA